MALDLATVYVSQHVRITGDPGGTIVLFNIGAFPTGAEGHIVEIRLHVTDGDYVVAVEMTDHFPSLDQWDNVIYLHPVDSYAEATLELFDVVIGFG
jgi:hypothetical protein